ncbi:MAG: hypothetical protein IKI58_02410 [Oscillospiraceae bacterium]|nr:hypothetical protein [Oscillospiraceae bacterium]
MEVYDALDHHRNVYLRDTRESEGSGYITNARKQDFYNYRLHFDPEQGYLLMADSDKDDDLIIRNFTMVNSRIVLHGVQEMGFEVTGVELAQTYELYQMKSGDEHHYHRYESLESNRYAHLTHEDYDLVYSGALREIAGDTIQQKLDMLFLRFNVDHPTDYRGRSMSTSDVVVINENGIKTPYYVQPTGYTEMPLFFADKVNLSDITFKGSPDAYVPIKVAARTDSFDYLTASNEYPPGESYFVQLTENAALADVQKLIQTAYDNGAFLTAQSVEYLQERFGADFMPELPPLDTVISIPDSGQTIDLAAVESFTLTDTYSEYEGGIDSDGHERRDNYSQQTETVTYTYRGYGIVTSEHNTPHRDARCNTPSIIENGVNKPFSQMLNFTSTPYSSLT